LRTLIGISVGGSQGREQLRAPFDTEQDKGGLCETELNEANVIRCAGLTRRDHYHAWREID
jgi:hypothetical protein